MNYSFDVALAQKHGVDEAIVIQNFAFWILKNKANNQNFYDGRTWTYNSMQAFTILFPFWSHRQIRTILESLRKQGVIITGNYNKSSYDRTLWYTFLDDSIYLNKAFHLSIQSNENDQKVKPIPDSKPDSKPDNKEEEKKPTSSSNDSLEQEKEDKPESKKTKLSDTEWIENLKTNIAYSGIDIDILYAKMVTWCEVKGKKPTRTRLLNWLNREDKPIQPKTKKPRGEGEYTIPEDEYKPLGPVWLAGAR